MTYTEFKRELTEWAASEFPDAKIKTGEEEKFGEKFEELSVVLPGSNAEPVFNIDAMYVDLVNGNADIEAIREFVKEIVVRQKEVSKSIDRFGAFDYDEARGHLFVKLTNIDALPGFDRMPPHKMIAPDLALTCHILMTSDDQGFGSAIVNRDLLEFYGVEEDRLFSDALESGMKLFPEHFDRDPFGIKGVAHDETVFSILTNRELLNGAAVIAYPGVLDRIAEEMGGDFILLPSSIHEFLVFDNRMDVDVLYSNLRHGNEDRRLLSEKDVLSYNIYRYNTEKKTIEIVGKGGPLWN